MKFEIIYRKYQESKITPACYDLLDNKQKTCLYYLHYQNMLPILGEVNEPKSAYVFFNQRKPNDVISCLEYEE